MKFLVDAQRPRRIAGWLVTAGCDTIHTLDLPDGNRRIQPSSLGGVMPRQISQTIPPTVDVLFPEDLSKLDGPLVSGQAEMISSRGDQGVGCLTLVERDLSWLDDFEHFVFQVQADGTRKAIRKATGEDIKRFRVPIWIQGEQVPICCGREMVFVGRIDDNEICTERPEDAKLWWHDAASFYVFSCPQCLECAAVGQQF